MANASAVPLGDGVTIASGLRTNLGYLLDCNQATYNITSGTEWHLLFIKATRSITEESFGNAWTFSLQSLPLATLKEIIEMDAPRIVDKQGQQMRVEINEESPSYPRPYAEVENMDTMSHLTSVNQLASFPDSFNGSNIRLDYYENRHLLTLATEVGTHIFPIAYHRIVSGTPSSAEIVQCARSDFHFWPLPTLPLWWKIDDLQALEAGIFTEIPE